MIIGNKVKIRKSSRFYGKSKSNPKITGIILKESPLRVRWDNGETNTYSNFDLELANPTIIVGSTGFVEEIDGIGHYNSFKQTNSLNLDHIAYDEWLEYKLHTEEIIDD